MGLEARCRADINGRPCEGKALLETTELVFRGSARLVVKLASIEDIGVEGPMLVIREGGRVLRLELGEDAAEKWLARIKNPKSVLDKLGIKPDHRVLALGVPDRAFLADLEARVSELVTDGGRGDHDLVLLGVSSAADLERVGEARARLRQDGALWVLRPKGGKEITEAMTMAAGKRAGLVDVKVVAFSPTHTAEKFVIPVKDRKR